MSDKCAVLQDAQKENGNEQTKSAEAGRGPVEGDTAINPAQRDEEIGGRSDANHGEDCAAHDPRTDQIGVCRCLHPPFDVHAHDPREAKQKISQHQALTGQDGHSCTAALASRTCAKASSKSPHSEPESCIVLHRPRNVLPRE